MCGIAGYIGKEQISESSIGRTFELMRNRGPDHRDHVRFTGGGNNVCLLHSRLSIIDLDERSNQPFTIGDCTLVFNGEIYNYVEIKKELASLGMQFRTQSDTEVLLQAYIAWGQDCVNKFEGMFSFAIYDRREEKLFLARDRFAEKPLYYYQTSDGFYFGSEIKFLRSLSDTKFTVNRNHLYRYLVNGYKSLYKVDEGFFEEVRELPFASCISIGSDLTGKVRRYWHPRREPKDMTLSEAIEGFRHHLFESMRIRLRGDVPIAFCLSGGVDSSSLVSISAKKFGYDVATFSIIDEDERYNEYDNIKATIDDIGCKHEIIHIPKENVFERLEKLIRYHDVPVSTISYYIHSFLSEAISEKGYKVAVSGSAADELATGYYDHFNLHLYEMRDHPDFETYFNDWMENTGKFVRNPYLKNPRLYFQDQDCREHVYLNNDVFAGLLKADFNESFIEEKYDDSLLRNRMLNELFHEVIPVILREDDMNSMMFSIENRSPFLDSRLFDFSYSIPSEHLIRDGYGKYVFRQSVDGVLNDQVRLDRRKKGFNASFASVVDLDDKKNIEYLLDDSEVFEIVEKDKIEKVLKKERPLPNSYGKFLFNFLNVKMFLELNKVHSLVG